MDWKSLAAFVKDMALKLWPKSRWANLIYLLLGAATASTVNLPDLIQAIINLFK
jgi:hypothetical protein